jgi:hypothetical protein
MTYAVFDYQPNKDAEERINSISLMLLTPKSSLKGFDAWHSGLTTKKLKSNTIEELAGYIACCEAQTNSVSIIKFKDDLDSDKYLMEFGDEYLGCINTKLKKDELIERVEVLQTLECNEYLKNWLSIKIEYIQEKLKSSARLTNNEIDELKQIELKSKNPYSKWISDREKRLNKS